jgi:hypothetical protein
MTLPSSPVFRSDRFPDVPREFLDLLNNGFRELYGAVAQLPSIGRASGKSFTTGASGTAYLDLKTDFQAGDLWVGKVAAADGSELATAYSQTWVKTETGVRLLFAGLGADSKYTCSVVYL